jgi:hypothetical protein
LPNLRQVLRNRIVDLQASALDELHEHDAGDRLGHGIDAEDRIELHRIVRIGRAPALHRHPGELATPRHQHDRARHQPVVDVALGCRFEALELRRRQPDLLRLADHLRRHLGMCRRHDGQHSQRKHRLFHERPPEKGVPL